MFKIISGDFAKDTSIQSDKLVEMRGFNFIKTSILQNFLLIKSIALSI